ncbi:SDR family NAD(P)-dependent oxidoreductase [Pseudoalteromonas xiamenensis]
MENLKIAIVTGAFGGIGTAIVKELIEEQCFVLAVASAKRTSADFDAWLNEHQINPTKVKPLFIDVTDQIACENALSDVIDSYGHVDILVNNAGITRDSTFKKMSASQWNEVINTNLNSLFNMTQPLFAQMCARKFGRIINISSVNGQKRSIWSGKLFRCKSGHDWF